MFLQALIALASACIHACRATGRHILAFEDKDIFDALLAPMRRPVVIPQPEILPLDIVFVDLDGGCTNSTHCED